MSQDSDWPFADPQNVAVFTTTHVVKARKPILSVSHDAEDGAWQFHSGDAPLTKDMMIVGLSEIVEIDPTVAELADMPPGFKATRASGSDPWRREPA